MRSILLSQRAFPMVHLVANRYYHAWGDMRAAARSRLPEVSWTGSICRTSPRSGSRTPSRYWGGSGGQGHITSAGTWSNVP